MMPRDRARALFPLAALLLAAVLVAAALPYAAAVTSSTESAATYWNGLPEELPEPRLPQGSTLYANDGKTRLATLFTYNRTAVPLSKVAPVMRRAIVDIEDSRFYTNAGVDLRGTVRALTSTGSGGAVQGGSTITQQYVKNALLLQAETATAKEEAAGRNLPRKLREAKYALYLDQKYTKDQILEKYLNIAYFGAGAYGVEAAAQRYFSTSAARLTLAQAATLAGLVQNPAAYDPTKNPRTAKKRRNVVLGRMRQLGHVSEAQRRKATASPIGVRASQRTRGCISSPYPFYCDWAVATLLRDPRLGSSPAEREKNLLEGALTITTGLDLQDQRAAQQAVDVMGRDNRVAAADVMVQPGTGIVRAMAVNRRYGGGEGETVFPLLSNDSFQPGSTFKAFTLAAALESGMPLTTRLPGGDRHRSQIFDNPTKGFFTNAGDGEGSNLTLQVATAKSVNTAYVQLQERVGTLAVADVAMRAGVRSITTRGKNAVGPKEGSLTLGSHETSPLDMASAYATFAAHGRYCPPAVVTAVKARPGSPAPRVGSACKSVIDPAVADTVTSVLTGVLQKGGTAAGKALSGRPAAGKTGTTENEAAAWFVGYTPQLSSAVVLADPRGAQRYPLHGVMGISRVYGGTIPASIWRQGMNEALTGQQVEPLPKANAAYQISPRGATVPDVRGLSATEATRRLRALGLKVTQRPGSAPSPVPPGTVYAMTPAAGTPLLAGGAASLSTAR